MSNITHKERVQKIQFLKYFTMVNGHCSQMYLMKYGYMDMAGGSGKSAPLLSKDGLKNYIREFQVSGRLIFLKEITYQFLEQ